LYYYSKTNVKPKKTIIMRKIQAIKPGPKPKKEDGSDDRRRRVDPPNQPKYPDLKPHIPKPKDR